MNYNRFSTADLMARGILGIPIPETAIPEGRHRTNARSDDCSFIGTDAVVTAIEAGDVVHALNYYGIPHVWKRNDGVYRGTLLQYRVVTEDETFPTAAAAAEWFERMYYSTDG